MRIGIVCYASVGGSGVVATELAHALSLRDHQVTLLSSERPFRWRDGLPGLRFERVDTPAYPLFREPQYLLALANAIVRVACEHRLDLVHAHYAVPHATAAYLADQILRKEAGGGVRTVTTLHGTDITLVGSDPSYTRAVAFSIDQSDAVTAVSESLRRDTVAALGIKRTIEVIPNFLDCNVYQRRADPDLRRRIAPNGELLVMHVSNFRPVKRVDMVLDVFLRVRSRVNARLVMIGDGPDRGFLEVRVREEGLSDVVTFTGEQPDPVAWLSAGDVFLLPSSQESFGLAALEAMACGMPVVASRVGGLPEVVIDGEHGYLCDPDRADEMADRVTALLADAERRQRFGDAAAMRVRSDLCVDTIVPQYEQLYRRTLAIA